MGISGVLWTWQFNADDECGSGELLTRSHAITPSSAEPPCCPPGLMHTPSRPEGPCLERRFCACDPEYCDLLHAGSCADENSNCPSWARYYCHGQYEAFMTKYCSKSCNRC